ncbi:MAG TPA: serine/threonine-protein kinase [Planctomycetota bacterium]
MTSKPEFLGKYQIQRELGRGGMAIVYEAVDTALGRRVAVKLLHPRPEAGPEQARINEERFLREARLCAALPKHAHVVGVHDAASDGDRRYIVMELVDGRPFSDWRREEKPPLPKQVEVLRDVALAVHHAHEHGVVHRDLKPANILVDAGGRPHVTDFGLAKFDAGGGVSLTADGLTVGTPGYMSPEQAQGLKSVDRRSDVYSLGVLLYEMIAGQTPYQGESAISILTQVIRDPMKPPSSVLASIDPTLEKICLKAVAKNVAHRYPTAKAFAEDLQAWLEGRKVVVDFPSPERPKSAWPWLIPGGLLAAAAAAIFLRAPAPVPPPPPPAPPPVVARLRAQELWTDSGFDVRAGETLEATCEGTWSNHEGSQPRVTAEGAARLMGTKYEGYTKKWPVAGARLMALVARVGEEGAPWVLPPGRPIRAPASGRIFLGPNDSAPGDDNGGEITVTLRKVSTSPADARAAIGVPLGHPWTDTGIDVLPDDTLTFVSSGPAKLRARVGEGAPWEVDYQHNAPAAGRLQLGPAAPGHGELKVTVLIDRREPGRPESPK